MRIGKMIASLFALFLLGMECSPATDFAVSVGGTSGGGYYNMPVLMFSPANLTITVGDSVTFNNSGGPHNVVADNGSFRCANGCDGAGGNGSPSSAEWSASVRFTQAGTFGYHCNNHSSAGMRGTITVRPAAGAAVTLASAFSGPWYNVDQGGHGFLVQQLAGNTMFVIWFVYSPDGAQQNWILAQAPYDPTQSGVTMPALLFEHGRFPPNFNPADVTSTPWGTLTLAFTGCNAGQATWTTTRAGYSNGTLPITRLASLAGEVCQ